MPSRPTGREGICYVQTACCSRCRIGPFPGLGGVHRPHFPGPPPGVYRQPEMLARIRPGAGRAGETLAKCGQRPGKGRLFPGPARAAQGPVGALRLDTVSSMRRKAGVWAGRAPGARAAGRHPGGRTFVSGKEPACVTDRTFPRSRYAEPAVSPPGQQHQARVIPWRPPWQGGVSRVRRMFAHLTIRRPVA